MARFLFHYQAVAYSRRSARRQVERIVALGPGVRLRCTGSLPAVLLGRRARRYFFLRERLAGAVWLPCPF